MNVNVYDRTCLYQTFVSFTDIAYVEALTLNDTVEVPPPNERVTVLLPVVVAVRETVNVPPDAVAEAGPESPELYDRLTVPA